MRSTDSRLLVRKPTLFALALMGAAIVTNLVLKPHAEAYCFGLFYSTVEKSLLCWEIVSMTMTSPPAQLILNIEHIYSMWV